MAGASSQKTSSLHERRGATSLWRLVAESLQRDIAGKKYAPGDQLPTEAELASMFDVHRNTVRRAMNMLRERDYVRIEQGRGTFVKEHIVRHELGPKTRLTAALRDIDRVGARRFLGTARIRAEKELARDLRVSGNHFLRKVDTLTLVDGAVVSVASSYFPLPRFEKIEQLIEQTGGFTESLKRYGVLDYRRFETRISAIQLSSADANMLGLTRRQPAIFLININVDADGVPIVVSHTRISPQHMQLVVRFEA